MHRTGATIVIKCITWPHEVVDPVAVKPAAYEELSMASFIQGYLIVMRGETVIKDKMAIQLEELMSDSDLNSRKKIKAFHGVC